MTQGFVVNYNLFAIYHEVIPMIISHQMARLISF